MTRQSAGGWRHVWFHVWLALVLVGLMLAGLARAPQALAGVGEWTSGGPSEAVVAVAVHPANDQEALAAGNTGVWQTTNGGQTWSKRSDQALRRAVVYDPQAPGTVYGVSADARTLLRSADGGATWSGILTGSGSTQLYDVWVDPLVPGRILAAGTAADGLAQVFRSQDNGVSWAPVLAPDQRGAGGIGQTAATALAAPAVPNVLFVGVQVYHGGLVLKSVDGGATWSTVYGGHLTPLAAPIALSAAGTSAAATTVYASFAVTGVGSLIRSDDGGATWTNLTAGLPLAGIPGGRMATNVLAHPARPRWIYASVSGGTGPGASGAGAAGVFASADGGQTWLPVGQPTPRLAGPHGLALALPSRTLWAATGEGVLLNTIAWPVADRFGSYYHQHDGYRLLGTAISFETAVNGYASQYFEKGRLEDHAGESTDPNWRFMYGLLVDELHDHRAALPVGGDVSELTYAGLHALADPSYRVAPPAGYTGGTLTSGIDGTTFIPFSADLSAAPGHFVPGVFWAYMNRGDLFPAGWLHDLGLPITPPRQVAVTKYLPEGPVERTITVQAFQRAILTFDPQNPIGWQVERANAGADYRKAFPVRVGP